MVQSQIEGRKQMREYPLPEFELYNEKELHMHSGLADEHEQEFLDITEESTAENLSGRLEHWLGIMNR